MSAPLSAPQAEETKDQRFVPPTVSLPKGGGAIKGIGEKFGANPVTGTGSLSIPLPLSPGRSGFTPALALSYDSGAGNGPYGFGWSVGYPHITRRTDRGLPRYDDRAESDVYILSGAEDLVPVLRPDGSRFEELRDGYRVRRYRPRIEGLFTRIERWSSANDASDTFWRSISRDDVTTVYGRNASSRIADPADPTRIFTWLLCESFDDKGNAAVYDYVAEDGRGVDLRRASESNRTEAARSANRYLKRVRYGNRTSRLVEPDLSRTDWLFEMVMDYGDHEAANPGPVPTRAWSVRPDPFSSSRGRFEVRTYRRCQRILMFHRFPELGAEPKLVRSLALEYDDQSPASGHDARAELDHAGSTQLGSFLKRAALTGFADDGFARSMPPLEFTYSRPVVSAEIQVLDEASAANLPAGVDGGRARWVDLDGEGISGVLSEQHGAWWYKPNRGQGRLAPQQLVAHVPSLAVPGRTQLLDLAGDGHLDFVEFARPVAGFFDRDDAKDWSPFRAFDSQPNIAWDDRNLRLVDLTGDGLADVLITEDDVIGWHPSLGEDGFGARQLSATPHQEDAGPRVVFGDATDTVFLADMSGDGLADLVRVRNGEVCYWPNLGYGRFGRKVTMDSAPVFDSPDQFDPRRLRLADIDGSGTVDIIYLGRDGVRLYFNRCGNGWTPAYRLPSFPPIDNLATVNVVDLLGSGTACLVWSTPLPSGARAPLRYVDLMAEGKPHLLVQVENNLGARTRIEYATSTDFYLADLEAGHPWITRLPFPVHVVERVETIDEISRNRFVTRYAYHHGFYDGVEREFRGFGMVEQRDTEELSALDAGQRLWPATNLDAASNVPPVLTRTWFHTGIYLGREHVSDFFAGLLDAEDVGEYYREPGWTDADARRFLLEDTILPPGLGPEAAREACRALKGAMLRQEVYALDGTAKEPHPYVVTEQNFTIRQLQPRGPNLHAVFFTHARESIGYHYERVPDDPRVAHTLTLEVDDFGNVRKVAAVVYGRRRPDPRLEPRDQQKQAELHVTYSETDFTNAVDGGDAYRVPIASESRSYHVTGMELAADRVRFTLREMIAATSAAVDIRYEQTPTPGRLERRIIEHARTLYRRDDLDGALPLGRVESRALPHATYQLALTPELVTQVYGDRVTDRMLEEDGRYVHSEGDGRWWIPSGRVFFSAGAGDTPAVERAVAGAHFFAPRRFRDPFGNDVRVTYDVHDFAVVETRDPLENVATCEIDYRVLQPRFVTDPNGNRSAAAFDALGTVVGTAVMGKIDETPRRGDSLEGFRADLPDAVVRAHLDDPLGNPHEILGRASTRLVYDLFAYYRTRGTARPAPAVVYVLARETHDADLAPGELTKVQHAFSYSDGFGRDLQKKAQAEPGPVPRRDPATGRIVVADGQAVLTDERRIRWIGSGWTIFNNKGQQVRQFEPFFTDTQAFEDDVRVGVSPILCYDPVGRVVATVHPDHTWEKVVFDPWRQETWDVNDTVLVANPRDDADVGRWLARLDPADVVPTWFAARDAGALGADEREAAAKTAVHAATPTLAHLDSVGRTFLTIVHNRFKLHSAPPDASPAEEFYATRVELDIKGNQRSVTDALDRVVMRYDYDLLSHRIHQASMEAGERWMLSEVAGQPIFGWNSRGFRFRSTYDVLRRPAASFVQGADPEAPAREILYGANEYGEGQPDAVALNLRGRAFRVRDTAGVVTSPAYDFKGNPLTTRRQLAADYKTTPDWSGNPELESELFESRTTYDALNRPVTTTTPDNSVHRPRFNEANLLERIDVNLRGAAELTTFVTKIDYDAKGQRQAIDYGNGVRTDYTYDPLTFRLVELVTVRHSDRAVLQDLRYTCDPVGNITQIRDRAQQTLYFNNQVVTPDNGYVYDAVYRLINATGREHIGQALHPEATWDDRGRVKLPHPGDGQAMRRYREEYRYDGVGNLLAMIHVAENGNWTRAYTYAEPSLVEAEKNSNRLTRTTVGSNNPSVEPYSHDPHGNMTSMPQLQKMQWDFKDALCMSQRQAVNLDDDEGRQGECTYYVYDAGGHRVRKVTQSAAGSKREERFYLSGFELYRAYAGGAINLERETLHVMDDRQRIALIDIRTRGDDGSPRRSARYQLSNHLSSASVELDDGARLLSYEEYCPYGNTSYQAGRGNLDLALKRYRYAGMEHDEETGLSYHGARYFACWFGRWTSPEPNPLIDGTNLYAYVRGNPVIFTDPSGHSPDDQRLGAKNEKAVAKQQKAADKRRAQEKRTPVEVNRQKGVGGKREVIPDEVKWLRGGTSDMHVIEVKGRHVDSKVNDSPSKRTADIKENLEQAKKQLQALEAAGEVGKTAKANVLRVIWDSDRGQSATAARSTWNQEAKDARNSWVNEAADPAERALRERVNVTTTTHDRLVKATRESRARAKFRQAPGGGLMGTAFDILGAIDIASDVSKGDLKSAGIKGGLLVIGTKVPGVGEALFGVAVIMKSRDPALRDISMSIGERVEDYTGSHVGGAFAAAGAHVLITVGATVGDMIWGMVPSDIQWGIKWAIEHHSPGSLIPAGVATPFIMHGGAGSFLRSPADAYREMNGADYLAR